MERESLNFYFIHFCAVCFLSHVHGLFSVKIINFLNPEQNEKGKQHHTHIDTETQSCVIKKVEGRTSKILQDGSIICFILCLKGLAENFLLRV